LPLKKIIQDIGKGLLHLIYPKLCVDCHKALVAQEEVLCIVCADKIPLTKDADRIDNETALRFAGRIRFKHAISYAYFSEGGLLQRLMHLLKYKKYRPIAVFLGRRLGYMLKNTSWIKDIDVIVPVPLHPTKVKKRGFNQSEIIAASMAEILKIPLDTQSLIRIKNTESQTNKSRAQRAENMKDVFGLSNSAQLKGKRVLLLDDILTTGATLESCITSLQKADGIEVSIVTIGLAID
jgi:ComF family protein